MAKSRSLFRFCRWPLAEPTKSRCRKHILELISYYRLKKRKYSDWFELITRLATSKPSTLF